MYLYLGYLVPSEASRDTLFCSPPPPPFLPFSPSPHSFAKVDGLLSVSSSLFYKLD
jgi:hypothetical protein